MTFLTFRIFILVFGFLEAARSQMYPLSSCQPIRVIHHDQTQFGSRCQMNEDMVTRSPHVYTAAPNDPMMTTARHCGVCYEIIGPRGSIRIMVTSACSPTCDVTIQPGDSPDLLFDLSNEAFAEIADDTGFEVVTYREVSCDVEGPIKLWWMEGSDTWSFYAVLFNHAVGVEKLEMELYPPGSGWVQLLREQWNGFLWDGMGVEAELPFKLRVTSWYGDVVEMQVNQVVSTGVVEFTRQFNVPRNESLDGTCCKQHEIHSKIYDDANLDYCWTDWSGLTETFDWSGSPHSGTSCIRVVLPEWLNDYTAYGCNQEALVSHFATLEFWARCDRASYDGLHVAFESPSLTMTHEVSVTGLSSSWTRFEIPISGAIPFESFGQIAFGNDAAGTLELFLDDVRLTSNPNGPNREVCAPGVLGSSSSDSGHNVVSIPMMLFLCVVIISCVYMT